MGRFLYYTVVSIVTLACGFSQAIVTTIDASADTEIDQHTNYMNANLGSATSMRVEVRSEAYTNPVVSPQSWGMIKWDLSGISATDTITDVVFQIQQVDSAVETVEVYAIDLGSWEETSVTWNSWASTTTSETHLGTMQNVAISSGVTTFSNANLTALVQDWLDGDHDNLGLLLKWSGVVGQGDTYMTRENTNGYIAPQLVITHVPEPATVFMMAAGGLALIKRRKKR